jgi:PAS domain S-box-containing protein
MFDQGTVMRQAEDQFRLLVEAVEDYAIFMLDPRGYVSTWNVGAQRIKQFEASEIIGKHFSCFYPEEDVRKGKPDWELVMAETHGKFEDEDWRVRKDGSRFWANVVITALRNRKGELVGFGKVTRDVTERMHAQKKLEGEVAERRDAERQLHISEKSLRELSLHLLRTQDEERRQIGRDLHDSLGQYLAVLKMKLDSLSQLFGPTGGPAAQDLGACVHLTEDCIKEVRTASYLLYPPMLEELGLKSAIPWYLDGFSSRSGVKTAFTVEAEFGRISRDAELALFRVLQEGLTNVHRHSGSETAYVRLSVADGFCALEIADEGVGIPQPFLEGPGEEACAFGVGLRGMSERLRQLGGRLEVVSNDKGTILRAIVPTGET